MRKLKFGFGKNPATFLTIIASIGVLATAVMSAKDTPKAIKRVKKAEKEKGEPLTVQETVVVAAPAYIPTTVVTVTTVACIFGINAMSRKSQASLASAYALLDRSYKEYRHKAVELFGEDADRQIQDSIAEDKYLQQKPEKTSTGLISVYDPFSERFFETCEIDVVRAENHINRLLTANGFVDINEFYDALGVDIEDRCIGYGWSIEQFENTFFDWIYIELIPCRGTVEKPEFYRIEYQVEPEPDYVYNYSNYYGNGGSQKLQIM